MSLCLLFCLYVYMWMQMYKSVSHCISLHDKTVAVTFEKKRKGKKNKLQQFHQTTSFILSSYLKLKVTYTFYQNFLFFFTTYYYKIRFKRNKLKQTVTPFLIIMMIELHLPLKNETSMKMMKKK